MESRLKIAGHPVHPILVMFPLGLLFTAVIFDAADLAGGPALLGEVAYYNIVAGLIGGALAAAAGLVDLVAIPRGTRAKRVAVTHALVNLGMLALFLTIALIRAGAEHRVAGAGLFIAELVALAGGGLGAWLGGELVDRLGVGVDPDAHLDATSSLRRPGANRIGNLGGVR
ncbi:MAG TPA: DUF2231 domain-containing protein [Catenuloplanes sp.]|jgi:uncharacterized membrane protein